MEYIIGSGAVLQSEGLITPASLHAQVDAALAAQARAVAIDFEGTNEDAPIRLLAVVQSATASQFRESVSDRLRDKRDCSLAEVLEVLASGAGSRQVHLFAHWLPGQATFDALQAVGIDLVAHPLESIAAASIVTGQRFRRVA